MAAGSWVYDGATWRGGPLSELKVYDGATWRIVSDGWVYDGAVWRKFWTAAVAVDCAQCGLCQAGGDPDCATLGDCNTSGEKHRITWTHTNCADASHHIAIHRSVDGGSYTEVADNVSCNNADPDSGCCSLTVCSSAEGHYLFTIFRSSALGGCTTTYDYRVRIETDGTDTSLDSRNATQRTGCDEACVGE